MSNFSIEALLKLNDQFSKQVNDALVKTQGKMAQFANKTTALGKSLSLKVSLPMTALAGVSIKVFDTQIKAETRVAKARENAGARMLLTQEQILQMASKLQDKSLYGDEEVLDKVSARLLTFKNINADVFEKTQVLIADYAAQTGSDLSSATEMIGKSINNPIRGLALLQRQGIVFTDKQKAMVEGFMAVGKTAEAQEIIFQQLNNTYKGTAEAMRKVGLGPFNALMAKLKGDLLEPIGALLLEVLNPAFGKLEKVVDKAMKVTSELSPTAKKAIATIIFIGIAIGPVLITIGLLTKAFLIMRTGFLAFTVIGKVFSATMALMRGAMLAFNLIASTNPLVLAFTAALGIILAVKNNLFGIRDMLESIASKAIAMFKKIPFLGDKLKINSTGENINSIGEKMENSKQMNIPSKINNTVLGSTVSVNNNNDNTNLENLFKQMIPFMKGMYEETKKGLTVSVDTGKQTMQPMLNTGINPIFKQQGI